MFVNIFIISINIFVIHSLIFVFLSLLLSQGLLQSFSLIVIICLLINFYFNVQSFIFLFYFILHLNSYSIMHFFKLIVRRANKSKGQVQRSHSIILVIKFCVLILIYFRVTFMEIFLNVFILFSFCSFLIFLLFC